MLFAAPSLNGDAANAYCDAHRAEWQEIWRQFDVPCDIAESVVYPELIRYSIIQDIAETTSLKALYLNKGADACNFSIGVFQMKPSFVEGLEERWMRSGLAAQYKLYFDLSDNRTARKVRVLRMEDENWQCVYVAVFLKMLYLDYGSFNKQGEKVQNGLEMLPRAEQVRLAAAAYNHGCRWVNPGYGSIDEIKSYSRVKTFHTAIVPVKRTKRYVYSDLAAAHFKRLENLEKVRK